MDVQDQKGSRVEEGLGIPKALFTLGNSQPILLQCSDWTIVPSESPGTEKKKKIKGESPFCGLKTPWCGVAGNMAPMSFDMEEKWPNRGNDKAYAVITAYFQFCYL